MTTVAPARQPVALLRAELVAIADRLVGVRRELNGTTFAEARLISLGGEAAALRARRSVVLQQLTELGQSTTTPR